MCNKVNLLKIIYVVPYNINFCCPFKVTTNDMCKFSSLNKHTNRVETFLFIKINLYYFNSKNVFYFFNSGLHSERCGKQACVQAGHIIEIAAICITNITIVMYNRIGSAQWETADVNKKRQVSN